MLQIQQFQKRIKQMKRTISKKIEKFEKETVEHRIRKIIKEGGIKSDLFSVTLRPT